jgi:SAM-dependent methyltransferase
MFALERKAMDPAGRVIDALDRRLPDRGLVLDAGAGDGFSAERLTTGSRRVVPMEPAVGMIRRERDVPWVRGDAELLPFRDGSFAGAYATWAYFFSREWDPTPGIDELHRAVTPGGPLAIVDNLDGDDFSTMSEEHYTSDPEFWERNGFELEEIETCSSSRRARRRTGSSASTSAIVVGAPEDSGSPSESLCTPTGAADQAAEASSRAHVHAYQMMRTRATISAALRNQ